MVQWFSNLIWALLQVLLVINGPNLFLELSITNKDYSEVDHHQDSYTLKLVVVKKPILKVI